MKPFDDIWGRYKDIHGWCLEEKARYLYNHILGTDPELVMEIGIFDPFLILSGKIILLFI